MRSKTIARADPGFVGPTAFAIFGVLLKKKENTKLRIGNSVRK
jgi:hypothetical protein